MSSGSGLREGLWTAPGVDKCGSKFDGGHEFSLILKSKWRDLNSRLGGCGICVSEIYFSNFMENKEGKKIEVTLSLIL